MTVSTTQIRQSYTGDGTSVNFPIPFPFYLASDLTVLFAGGVISTGFSISGGGSGTPLIPGTGTLTMATPPPLGVNLQIILTVPLTQLVQLVDGTAFPSATLNQVHDRAVQAELRLNDIISRAIRAPDGDVAPLMILPPAAARASSSLGLDSSGNITTQPILPGALTQPAFNLLLSTSTLYTQTGAETAAFIALGYGAIANYFMPPGVPDRYTANAAPGTTLMLQAIVIAFTQALQPGGATVQFLPAQYFVGTITNAGARLATIFGLQNCTVYGNGAQITCNTTASSSLGAPVIFTFQNAQNVTIDNLGGSDAGFDITQTWKGAQLFAFTMTDATDRERITVQNCLFKNLVNGVFFWTDGGGTGRYRGITLNNTYDNCYYGPNFQEIGDEAEVIFRTRNCLRSYYAYGVSGHKFSGHVWHDATSSGATGCIVIKRYQNDTRAIGGRVDFHGFNSQWQSVVDFEIQTTAGTAAITALGAITAGSGGTDATYYGVPLTGGSGANATGNITIRSGAAVRCDIANPGKGYLAGDNLGAAAANIGNCAGFAVAVSQVGGRVEGIDIDMHMEDAQQAVGVAVPAPAAFTSYQPNGTLNGTTTDLWDRIVIRGNPGQGAFQPITIRSTMTGVGPGRIGIGPDMFDASPTVPSIVAQDFPGFVVKLANNVELYGLQGNLTTAPLSIDLTQYAGRFFTLEVDVEAESDYSNTSGNQTSQKFYVTGAVTTALNASLNPAPATIVGPVVVGGTSAAPALSTSGKNLTVTFSNYTGTNARARVTLRHLSRLR